MKLNLWNKKAARALPTQSPEDSAKKPEKKKRSWLGSMFHGMFSSANIEETDQWVSTPMPIDFYITTKQPTLVARSREQWSNNDYVRAYVRILKQNVIGPNGVKLQSRVLKPRGGLDEVTCAAIEADWEEFCQLGNCDVTGTMSMTDLANQLVETLARDGEYFFLKVYGKDAGPHGFALQAIDPQRCPVMYTQDQGNGNVIRQGIEYNRYGKPIAYHFNSTDAFDDAYYSFNGAGFVRVPAEHVIHDFIPEMVGQRRGLPQTSSALIRLHHLERFEKAALQNARNGANTMGAITWREGFGPDAPEDGPIHIEAEPLGFFELPEGADLKEFKPQYPNNEFDFFQKAMLRGAAAGLGVPYHDLGQDLSQVNYSSIRHDSMSAQRYYKSLQNRVKEHFYDRTFKDHLEVRLLSQKLMCKGKPLPAANKLQYQVCHWQAQPFDFIDPESDMKTRQAAVRTGFRSIQSVIREMGEDPDHVFQEISAGIEKMKALGIPDQMVFQFFNGQPMPPTPAAPATSTEG